KAGAVGGQHGFDPARRGEHCSSGGRTAQSGDGSDAGGAGGPEDRKGHQKAARPGARETGGSGGEPRAGKAGFAGAACEGGGAKDKTGRGAGGGKGVAGTSARVDQKTRGVEGRNRGG